MHKLYCYEKKTVSNKLVFREKNLSFYTAKINNDIPLSRDSGTVTDNNFSLTVANVNYFSVTQEFWVEDITSHMLTIQTTDGIVTMTAAARYVQKQYSFVN